MNLGAFLVGIMLFVASFILYFTKDDYVSQAVNSSTSSALGMVFPIFLVGGFIFVFIGMAR